MILKGKILSKESRVKTEILLLIPWRFGRCLRESPLIQTSCCAKLLWTSCKKAMSDLMTFLSCERTKARHAESRTELSGQYRAVARLTEQTRHSYSSLDFQK